jgi:hypothetical protein
MAAILANYNLISWCQKRDILGFPNWKMKWPVLPGCSMSCLIDGKWRRFKTSETTRAVSFSSQCVLFSVGSKAPYLYFCLVPQFLGILSGYSVTRDFHQGSTAPRPSSHALRPLQWGPGYEKHQTGIPATADFHREKSGKMVGSCWF